MICPLCADALIILEERTCDDVYGCECGEGFVGLYICTNNDCQVTIVSITEDCQDYGNPKEVK